MIVVGLTGSIGMGKSTALGLLRRLGIAVFSDDAVHRLLAGTAVPLIEAAFPAAVRAGRVDRGALAALVFADPKSLTRLETLLHPLVVKAEQRFLRLCRQRRRRIAVLDIPLLFESRAERRCDTVVVVSCPPFLQTQRVLARPGMTRQRLASIRHRQLDDVLKRRRADFVVASSLGRRAMDTQLKRVVSSLLSGYHSRDCLHSPSARRR